METNQPTIHQGIAVMIVLMEDELIHDANDEYPTCSDPTCPCHDAQEQREAAQQRNATIQCVDGSWW